MFTSINVSRDAGTNMCTTNHLIESRAEDVRTVLLGTGRQIAACINIDLR